MKQQTLAGSGFDKHRKPTRREQFLQQMDALVPWSRLVALVEPYYPTGERGRPPVGLERMLRLHCLGHWYNLPDPSLEEALYDIDAMRRFVGIDLGREPAPDETTICKFRHLLEQHELGASIFTEINAHLAEQGIQVSGGTMVDATIIDAPSSTKNEARQRDPEMHQTRKGNQWYFGMKGHFGVDSRTKLIHSVVVTAANTADGTVLGQLLHGDETRVWGDKAYDGQGAAIAAAAPAAQDHTHDKGHRHRPLTPMQELANHYKSTIRAKVEHPIGTIKRVFGFTKVRYKGLAKNANRLYVAAALANLFMVRRRLSPAV
jgi:IS5 family transposase